MMAGNKRDESNFVAKAVHHLNIKMAKGAKTYQDSQICNYREEEDEYFRNL